MSNLVPEGWSYNPLSLLADVDKDSLKTSTDPDYRFRYIDIASVSTGQVKLPSEYIKFSDAPSRARRKLQQGDVLMSTVRPNLKAFAYFDVSETDFVASTGFSVIRAKNGNDGRFIFNAILGDDISSQIDSLVVGSNYPAINSSDVKNLEVLTPSPAEQQKIAKILTSVDEVIDKTQAQIDKLKDLKTGMMQELLTKGVGVDGKPHTEFKDSPVGRIPKAWQVKKIGNLFDVQLGKMLSKAAKVSDTPLPYLGNKNVQWGRFDLTTLETMDFSEKEREKFSLRSGDLLMCEGGDVGRCAIWESKLTGCYYQKALHRLRPINKSYEPFLLMEYMKFAKDRGLLTDYVSQTSIAHLTREKLVSISVPVPSKHEQHKIVATLKTATTKLDIAYQKLCKFNELKRALMQDLLTGKVRVTID
ncbi:restriction endonuclease subunit S [Shewanella indica]|uniref:restriction endonuclease subunit S n=1 Tax=Shewanella indica TaxID=768528 RepID=UPI00313C3689